MKKGIDRKLTVMANKTSGIKMRTQSASKAIEVLLVEGNPGYVRFLRESLATDASARFDLTTAGQLIDTIKCLDEEQYDIVVLDPSLPDSKGFATFSSVRMHAPNIPIILLSGTYNEKLAVRALQNGAQDCLIKDQLDGNTLSRCIRHAIERHRIMADLEHTRQKEYHMAYYDALTSLPNRQLFHDRLNQAISHAHRYDEKMAVMFIDLDGFKSVNDSMGHDCGDLLLKDVAKRLEDCLRKSDTVARIGGDEFTCILPHIKNKKDVSIVAKKIIVALARPFDIRGHRIFISGSIGASLFPDDTDVFDKLIKNADTAMYNAKKQGKNNFKFFADHSGVIAPESIQSGNNLRTAIEARESRFSPG
jgi:diguanylate cyclase (GGDEF)-like protein